MKRLFVYLSVVLLFCACHSKPEIEGYMGSGVNDDVMEEEMMPITRQETVVSPPPNKEMDVNPSLVDKKIIKDGRMGLKVQELIPAKAFVDSLVNHFDAYYGKENFHKSRFEISYSLVVRIPFANFDSFISHLESRIGEVQYKTIDARDVTAEFIDLETRLANKESYLLRYKELLKKAHTVKDILTIEQEIRKIEEEIESKRGQLKYLGNQVKFSTLQLDLNQEKDYVYVPKKADRFIERLKESLSGGWQGFVGFMLFLLQLWPFLILFTFILVWWKHRREKRKALKSMEKLD